MDVFYVLEAGHLKSAAIAAVGGERGLHHHWKQQFEMRLKGENHHILWCQMTAMDLCFHLTLDVCINCDLSPNQDQLAQVNIEKFAKKSRHRNMIFLPHFEAFFQS
jgi:hypothetical protein